MKEIKSMTGWFMAALVAVCLIIAVAVSLSTEANAATEIAVSGSAASGIAYSTDNLAGNVTSNTVVTTNIVYPSGQYLSVVTAVQGSTSNLVVIAQPGDGVVFNTTTPLFTLTTAGAASSQACGSTNVLVGGYTAVRLLVTNTALVGAPLTNTYVRTSSK